MSGNTIINNAAQDGGGLYLDYSDNVLVNNFIADNTATRSGNGNGLYMDRSILQANHNTIAHNYGGGGEGLYVTGQIFSSSLQLSNTILVSHDVGIIATEDSKVMLEATLWGDSAWANGTDWKGAGTIITGTRNFWGEPAFVDPDAGDYHLGAGSAAIDRGVETGLTTDIDGDPRPAGRAPDIGADEFTGHIEYHYIYLPLALRQTL